MIKRFTAFFLALFIMVPNIKSEGVLNTSTPDQLFSLGVRIGFNTSNKTFANTPSTLYNNNSWGTGFNLGVVANLNFKEYLSIQPGLFFESRSGNYTYLYWYNDYFGEYQEHWAMGHQRSYNVTVPVMAIVKFKLSENLKTSVELGPYFQYIFKYDASLLTVPYQVPQTTTFATYLAEPRSVDGGLKMGAGIQFLKHYYLGVHYLAGFCNAWRLPEGGKKKEWTFTVGYDF